MRTPPPTTLKGLNFDNSPEKFPPRCKKDRRKPEVSTSIRSEIKHIFQLLLAHPVYCVSISYGIIYFSGNSVKRGCCISVRCAPECWVSLPASTLIILYRCSLVGASYHIDIPPSPFPFSQIEALNSITANR